MLSNFERKEREVLKNLKDHCSDLPESKAAWSSFACPSLASQAGFWGTRQTSWPNIRCIWKTSYWLENTALEEVGSQLSSSSGQIGPYQGNLIIFSCSIKWIYFLTHEWLSVVWNLKCSHWNAQKVSSVLGWMICIFKTTGLRQSLLTCR